ncbi:MAG: glycosyltransferase, partial [Sphingomonadales bacterium]|nr:glycosyltransferase [Sphingomonadales bacterium]
PEDENADTATQILRNFVTAVAPDRAVGATCFLRVELPEKASDDGSGRVQFYLSEPHFVEFEGEGEANWQPSIINSDLIDKALRSDRMRVYHAQRQASFLRTRDGRVEVYSDGADGQVIRFAPPELNADAEVRLGSVKGDGQVVQVKRFGGVLYLAIDGKVVDAKNIGWARKSATYVFELPNDVRDRDYHRLELIEASTLKTLAADFRFISDHLTPWAAITKYAMPPLPAPLSPKASHWMESLEGHLARLARQPDPTAAASWLIGHLPRIKDVLVQDFERNRDFFPLVFPEVETPEVSIVVPVHNEYPATFHCLCSLLFAPNDTSFEVIVVDDGSSDATAEELAKHQGITVVGRESAGGFVEACNLGAGKARGNYVLFLNNDCEVTAGWLDELVRVFSLFPDAGAACSKLLYPNGKLQDAGGIVYNNGQPANYGHGENPADPRFSYSRDADYLTGAALITRTDLWNEIGGFAQELAPAYFEDTWYSFAVREAGYRTIYCATSEVYHVRGVSNGEDVDTKVGLKRFQKINHPKFKRRWHRSFASHASMDVGADSAKDGTAKGRVLMIGWEIPMPDQNAGSYSTVQEIRMLQDLGFKVTFLPANLAYFGRYTEDMQRMGVECIHAPFYISVEQFLADRGGEYDVVLASYYRILDPIEPSIRRHAPQAALVLNIEDLHFLREMRRAVFEGSAEREEEAHRLREEELAVLKKPDLIFSYSDLEILLMQSLLGGKPAMGRLPWVEETRPGPAPFAERTGLCFLGSYNHPPNAEAAAAFDADIAPLLEPGNDQHLLHVYGSNWPREDEAGSFDLVKIEGFAESLDETFDRHRIFAAPLRSGAGVKGKVLAAMARGIPTILSPVAAEGIQIRDGQECLIAESAEEWAAAIGRLSKDEKLWRAIREGGL